VQALLDSVKSLSARERKALAALLKRQGVNLYGVTPIFRREAEDTSALSYAQRRQWFLWQLEPHSAAYNMPVALRLSGVLDVEALRRSFEALVARHETLRTTFRQDGDEAVQVIHAAQPFVLAVEPLAAERLQAAVEEEIQRPFDLQQGPLLRVRLFSQGLEQHVLVLTQHHIVSDGWSMPIMIDELVRCYEGYSQGREVHLPGLPIQYADYAIWQRNWMEAGEQERQLAYWKTQLGGEQPVLELPCDRPRPAQPSWRGGRVHIELGEVLAQDLKHLARQQGVTLFMLLLASLQTLLHRYSGQADIRVGVPVANRNRAETEGLIGFFVNTQVLKAEFDGRSTVASLLQQVKQAVVGAQAHQDLPFEQLVEALQPERSMSRSPLFQVIFNHQTEVRGEARQLAGLKVEALESDKHTAQFDLALNAFESEAGIGASLVFASDLFDAATVERMAEHWRNLLRGLCADSAARIAELPLHSSAERERTLRDWNRQLAAFPSEQCAHQLIEAQAARVPDAVALSFGEQRMTYARLNSRANQLAHKLREQGVGPDVRVGLSIERGLDMLVGILGILKAGGAYVPLDPDYPQDRLDFMATDSGIKLLLTRTDLLSLEGYSEDNPVNLTSPDNLAYVIYTSGSTGKPKGALLPHRNLLRLFTATDHWFGFDEHDVWTLFHSYAFDFSVWEIFGALLYGGRLVIVPREVTRSPEDFHRLLVDERVTVLNQTPSAFKQLARVACESSADLALRYVVFGGEALDVGSLKPWFERFGDQQPQLINMYGITETTVHVTYRPIGKADLQQAEVSPIGEAIPDLSWYVLDADFNPVALGCTGELHVGHAGLARGYHNRAALTAERFVPNPFTTDGSRLYRTGDLARYRAEGVIEYAGRIDHQVKIRGFRIELGEIEARLQEHPGVREAIVLAVDGVAGQQLAAWFVPRDAAQADLRDNLKAHLKANLPDYMVPTHLIALDAMPLTANGKLDRKALPKPDASLLQGAYQAPRTEQERRLAAIWSELLGVERVGLGDNFFALGGHSLLVIAAVGKIREAFDVSLSLNDFMLLETFEDLADLLRPDDRRMKSPVVTMNAVAGTGEPLFCLPPGGGAVYSYYPLAGHLSATRRVVGVVNRNYVVPGWFDESWQEMVAYYVGHIRATQAQGPYHLLGWSLGGALAMEVAHVLEQAGEEVAFLGLVDTTLPLTDDVLPVDAPANQDEPAPGLMADLVRSLVAFVPGIGEQMVHDLVAEGRARFVEQDEIADWVIVQVAAHGGVDVDGLRSVYRNIAVQDEIESGYKLLSANIRLARDFTLKPLRVVPHCWWAGASKTTEEIAAADALLKVKSAINGLVSSTLAGENHDRIILGDALLAQVLERLK